MSETLVKSPKAQAQAKAKARNARPKPTAKDMVEDPDGRLIFKYQVRELPWGETGQQAETRLHRRGDRMKWRKRAGQIMNSEKCGFHNAAYEAFLEFPPERFPDIDLVERQESDTRFLEVCRTALKSNKLPDRASIEQELSWIGANMHRSKPFTDSAPSIFAISWLIDVRTNPRVRERFWSTVLTKRLSPGETRKKQKALKEDAQEDLSEASDNLVEHLFGDEEDS